MKRVIGGLLLSALMSGIASGLLFYKGIGVFFTVPCAFAAAFVLGLPMYFLLRRMNWLAFWQVTLAGVACASPFAFATNNSYYVPVSVLISGGMAGAFFWWSAIGDSQRDAVADQSSSRGNPS
jgi:uncharacterized membrane protein YjjP (DUF1212 family)